MAHMHSIIPQSEAKERRKAIAVAALLGVLAVTWLGLVGGLVVAVIHFVVKFNDVNLKF